MRTAVTRDMAGTYGYDVDELMNRAFSNTISRFRPVFTELGSFCKGRDTGMTDDPFDEEFSLERKPQMYILTNEACHNGASVIFYPFVAERIGELLGEDYYVLPSSLHEVIIVPRCMGFQAGDLKKMVRDANDNAVAVRDLLSYKVLFYSREENSLSASVQ